MLTSRLAVAAMLAAPATAIAQHTTPVPGAPALRALAHTYYEWRDTSYPVDRRDARLSMNRCKPGTCAVGHRLSALSLADSR
jgi:hypothetical protein